MAKAPPGSRVISAAKLHAQPPRDRGTQGSPPRRAMPPLAWSSPEQIGAEEVAVLGEAIVLDHVRGRLSHGDTEGKGQQRWHRWLCSGGREGAPGPDVPVLARPLRSMAVPPRLRPSVACWSGASVEPRLLYLVQLSFLYLGLLLSST